MFLWIDALCIDQDNENLYTGENPYMSVSYALVAAAMRFYSLLDVTTQLVAFPQTSAEYRLVP